LRERTVNSKQFVFGMGNGRIGKLRVGERCNNGIIDGDASQIYFCVGEGAISYSSIIVVSKLNSTVIGKMTVVHGKKFCATIAMKTYVIEIHIR
jgi:hypothetical protein